MKRKLHIIDYELFHYKNGQIVPGLHEKLIGNVSGLSGNVSGIRGDVSGLRGDVSGLSGDVSGLSGNVDDCEISPNDRKAGIDIQELVIDKARGKT